MICYKNKKCTRQILDDCDRGSNPCFKLLYHHLDCVSLTLDPQIVVLTSDTLLYVPTLSCSKKPLDIKPWLYPNYASTSELAEQTNTPTPNEALKLEPPTFKEHNSIGRSATQPCRFHQSTLGFPSLTLAGNAPTHV